METGKGGKICLENENWGNWIKGIYVNLDNINLLDFQTADKTENSQNESDESTDQVFAGGFF